MHDAETIAEQSLIDMARAGGVRSLRAVESGNGSWALVATIGMAERALRSQREDVRLWRSLDTVYRYCRERIGINQIEIRGA